MECALNLVLFLLAAVFLFWLCLKINLLLVMIFGPGDSNGGDWDTLENEPDNFNLR